VNEESDKLFSRKIDYEFENPALLNEALSHRSIKSISNERLEFLGDSILNFVIAAALFKEYPDSDEGELSRLRSSLVKGTTLAELGREFDIGSHLRLGAGELKSGGFRRESLLADAIEAVIGAIYLDTGFASCESMVLKWFASRLADIEPTDQLKDPKTLLQEYVQSKRYSLPNYETVSVEGDAHDQIFNVQCTVEEISIVSQGTGSSRRRAEQVAASNFLEQLDSNE